MPSPRSTRVAAAIEANFLAKGDVNVKGYIALCVIQRLDIVTRIQFTELGGCRIAGVTRYWRCQ